MKKQGHPFKMTKVKLKLLLLNPHGLSSAALGRKLKMDHVSILHWQAIVKEVKADPVEAIDNEELRFYAKLIVEVLQKISSPPVTHPPHRGTETCEACERAAKKLQKRFPHPLPKISTAKN